MKAPIMSAPEEERWQWEQSAERHFARCWDPDEQEETDEASIARKELRMLSFSHPGKFMDNFDPERSTREMRKMNRRIYRETLRKNQLYDETGHLIENGKDLCDCLEVECPGCHYPCHRCQSPKCGTECRASRKWVYEFVEVEGTNLVIKWPSNSKS
ncbi:ARL14 effector protein-like [Liolophura sinensis]|uniref:ARL14 effector protein-like n=1 Tax=Liolophura sinensis TaxID=3198878 RepID=UPI00315895C4